MRSLLLIFVCALVINSQARTLTEKRDQLDETSRKPPTGATDYNRPGTPPPPAPKPGKPILIEMIITARSTEQNTFWIVKNYGRDEHQLAPPSPKEAPPTHQVTGGGAAALGNYGKDGGELTPPAPHHAPSEHDQVPAGGGVAVWGNYGKDGGELTPPTPHHAPPTHQVSAAEMEKSLALFSS